MSTIPIIFSQILISAKIEVIGKFQMIQFELESLLVYTIIPFRWTTRLILNDV